MEIIIMKIIFLFLAVWLSVINVGKIIYKEDISVLNTFFQAAGITGFIVLQFLI